MVQSSPATERSAEAPSEPPGADRAGHRDPFFDNAKLITLVLVVCAHFWEILAEQPGSRTLHALYLLVYAFHMPVFIMVSGYFSRSFVGRPHQLRRLLAGVLIPYLLWNTLLGLFDDLLSGDHASLNPLLPVWVTWFLLSLFLWRLTAPFWQVMRYPVAVSVVLFLLSGAFPLGMQLSITRTLQFLPFFVIGLTLRPAHLHWVRTSRALRVAALPLFAACAVLADWAVPRVPRQWVYRYSSASDLNVGYLHWVLEAGALFLIAIVLTAAFLALVPRRRTWFTGLGAGTMYAFLLHGFVRQALFYRHVYDRHFLHTPAGQVLLTAVAVALALLLCTAPVRRVFRPVVEPVLAWFFAPEPSRQGPSRQGPSRRSPAR